MGLPSCDCVPPDGDDWSKPWPRECDHHRQQREALRVLAGPDSDLMRRLEQVEKAVRLAALPDADLLTATKIDDPIDAGIHYSAGTVSRLIAAERERCAKLVEEANAWRGSQGEPGLLSSREIAALIRKSAPA